MPRFVEVGAFDCEHWSYTYQLAIQGWVGLMFEPQPDMVAMCKKCYAEYPNVIIDQCAIGNKNLLTKLYLGGSLSTIRPDMLPVMRAQGYNLREDHFILVQMHTLDERLSYYRWQPDFDLLVVDVEGAEMLVLNSFTITEWRPKKCIIEACDPCPDPVLTEKTAQVRAYFAKNGYKETKNELFDLTFEREDLL